MATCTAGVIGRFGVVLLGCTRYLGYLPGPGLMPKDELTTAAMPSADASSRYPLPALVRLTSENVATPATAFASFAKLSPPGFAFGAIPRCTLPVKLVITLPWPSL